MIRSLTVALAILLTVGLASAAFAQEEVHYEGYSIGTNPNPESGTPINARGLVTALYNPLVSDFTANEYTWVISGLVSQGSVLKDSSWETTYVPGGNFTIWEDPCQNARPTFYLCPSDIVGLDPRYEDNCSPVAGYYLQGHFTAFKTTFDIHTDTYGQGTFVGTLNWDSGNHINDLP